MNDIEKSLNDGAGYPWIDLEKEDPSFWMVTFRTLCGCERFMRMGPWRKPPGKLRLDMATTSQKRNRQTGKFETHGTPMQRVFLVANFNPWDRTAKFVEQVPR